MLGVDGGELGGLAGAEGVDGLLGGAAGALGVAGLLGAAGVELDTAVGAIPRAATGAGAG